MNHKLKRIAAVVAAVLVASVNGHAAIIQYETIVRGQESKGYVLIRPELRSVSGGRVQWDPNIRRWVTDRAARTEKLRISIFRTPGESPQATVGVRADNGFFQSSRVVLDYVDTRFSVSPDPSFDNVVVFANTSRGHFELRLPIGTR